MRSILTFKIDANTLMLSEMDGNIVLLLIKNSLCKNVFFCNFMEILCCCCALLNLFEAAHFIGMVGIGRCLRVNYTNALIVGCSIALYSHL